MMQSIQACFSNPTARQVNLVTGIVLAAAAIVAAIVAAVLFAGIAPALLVAIGLSALHFTVGAIVLGTLGVALVAASQFCKREPLDRPNATEVRVSSTSVEPPQTEPTAPPPSPSQVLTTGPASPQVKVAFCQKILDNLNRRKVDKSILKNLYFVIVEIPAGSKEVFTQQVKDSIYNANVPHANIMAVIVHRDRTLWEKERDIKVPFTSLQRHVESVYVYMPGNTVEEMLPNTKNHYFAQFF